MDVENNLLVADTSTDPLEKTVDELTEQFVSMVGEVKNIMSIVLAIRKSCDDLSERVRDLEYRVEALENPRPIGRYGV